MEELTSNNQLLSARPALLMCFQLRLRHTLSTALSVSDNSVMKLSISILQNWCKMELLLTAKSEGHRVESRSQSVSRGQLISHHKC